MNILNNSRILMISPHPDDVEFGAAATLHEYKDSTTSKLLVLSNRHEVLGEKNNEEQQRKSADILGIDELEFFDLPIRFFIEPKTRDRIRRIVEDATNNFRPDLILVPAKNETHQDHQAVTSEVTRMSRSVSVFGYEVITHNKFVMPTHKMYVKVSEDSIKAKVRALHCFEEQKHKYYFDERVVSGLATVRATHAGFLGMAEAFDMYNLIQEQPIASKAG